MVVLIDGGRVLPRFLRRRSGSRSGQVWLSDTRLPLLGWDENRTRKEVLSILRNRWYMRDVFFILFCDNSHSFPSDKLGIVLPWPAKFLHLSRKGPSCAFLLRFRQTRKKFLSHPRPRLSSMATQIGGARWWCKMGGTHTHTHTAVLVHKEQRTDAKV